MLTDPDVDEAGKLETPDDILTAKGGDYNSGEWLKPTRLSTRPDIPVQKGGGLKKSKRRNAEGTAVLE